ncbi:DEKNAAC102613 [Brettanomyces naardenensis]|uniref:DEKNAAC102613 n=1 Tax=Brettanomyces naardenensis TaxID=13370 RepID=A0A448YKE2_BRENA|nr:DEKNAAC102613 [Brettanomyces naardenensis]
MLVLKESEVRSLVTGLSADDIKEYQDVLLDSLIEYYHNRSILPPRIVTTTPYATHLFMASTGSAVGMKALTGSGNGFAGLTTILDKFQGFPVGILNASTLTAFRTALCTTLALVKAFPLDNSAIGGTLICYGVGAQAEWHIRLTLQLFSGRFSKVVIANRTVSKADSLVTLLRQEFKQVPIEAHGIGDGKELAKQYEDASVIYSCVPSTSPTVLDFQIEQCRRSKVFIGAIGSYKPQMIEIDGDLIKKECLDKGGRVIVDSVTDCLAEAGEFILNDIGKESLVELASIYLDDPPEDAQKQLQYLKTGRVVICKLVGLCIMDISVGSFVLKQAERRHIGTLIEGF